MDPGDLVAVIITPFDCMIDGLEGVFAYMDDSCVGSPDRQAHYLHLEAFLTQRFGRQ